MRAINIHEAKTQLSKLVEEAARGEPFIIAKAGKPMVKVVAIDEAEAAKQRGQRRLGFMTGQYTVPEDFDTMMQDEIVEMFEGDADEFWRIYEEGPDAK